MYGEPQAALQEKTGENTSRCEQVAQAQSKPWDLLPAIQNQHAGIHTFRLIVGPIQGPLSCRKPLRPGKGTGQGLGSRVCHVHSGPSGAGCTARGGDGTSRNWGKGTAATQSLR